MRPRRDLPPPLGATLRRRRRRLRLLRRARRRGRGRASSTRATPTDRAGRAVRLEERAHGTWFGFVPGIGAGQRYALRVHGPWRPAEGMRHNPDKLLLDPYARAIEGDVTWRPEVFGHWVDDAAARRPRRARRSRQRAVHAPLRRRRRTTYDWEDDVRPQVPWTETVIYETHVRNLTRLHPDVPEELRGTYAGLAHPAVAAHLTELGVTTVELLPVQAFTPEPAPGPARPGQPLGLQHPRLLRPARAVRRRRPTRRASSTSSRAWSRLLHREGIEVILDVVYNHTAEQGRDGATLSWRGLDNRAYYRLDERGQRHRRHRLRQHPGPAPPGGLPDGARLAALLGAASATSTASASTSPWRSAAAATTATTPTTRSSSRCAPTRCCPGSSSSPSRGTSACTAGAPASSRRRSRSGTTASATAVRAFWLPRRRALRPRPARPRRARAGDPARRVAGPVRRAATGARSPRSTTSPPTTASPWPTPRRTSASTTAPTARATATATATTGRGTTASRAPTPTRTCCAPAARSMRNLLGTLLLSTGVPMLNAGDEMGRTQRRQQQRLLPGQRGVLAGLGPRRGSAPTCSRPPGTWPGCAPRTRCCAGATSSPAGPVREGGGTDLTWFAADGQPMHNGRWDDPHTRTLAMHLDGTCGRSRPRCSSSCTATPWTRR